MRQKRVNENLPDGPHADLGELVAVVIERQHDLIHDSRLGVTQEGGGISLGEPEYWNKSC